MKAAFWSVPCAGLLAFLLFETLALPATARSTSAATLAAVEAEAEPRAAWLALHAYFAAIEDKACARVLAVTTPERNDEQCRADLAEFERHHFSLSRVVRLTKDGRNAHAWIATTKVVLDGRERDVLFRVESHGSGFKVHV